VINHPELELVGHYVWSPEKVGKDSGVLCGREPVGVIATDDWAPLLDLKADCLSYFGDALAGREAETIGHCIPFLERGTNVVSLSAFALAHPPSAPAALRDPVEAACRKGGSTMFFSGIDPGWATTDMAIAALAAADRVDCVRVLELGWFGSYPSESLREYFGFGEPPGFSPKIIADGFLKEMWEPTLRHITDALGVEIEGWETLYEVDTLDHDIEAGIGLVKAGTAVTIHFELRALAGGKPIAIVEHVDSIGRGAGKGWKKPYAPVDLAHRVEIEGDPNLSVEISYPPDGSARATTVMPVVNAIPVVCAAQPGLLGPLDIPRYWARNVRKVG
jgi:hypothetical protein